MRDRAHRPDAQRRGPASRLGLHVAGYRHVVAALCAVPDFAALRLSRAVHTELAEHDELRRLPPPSTRRLGGYVGGTPTTPRPGTAISTWARDIRG